MAFSLALVDFDGTLADSMPYWLRLPADTLRAAGLPQPGKSSCFFCPSMRAEEIIDLRERYPDLFRRALALEDNARANLKTVRGLGRNYSWKERFGKEICKNGND